MDVCYEDATVYCYPARLSPRGRGAHHLPQIVFYLASFRIFSTWKFWFRHIQKGFFFLKKKKAPNLGRFRLFEKKNAIF